MEATGIISYLDQAHKLKFNLKDKDEIYFYTVFVCLYLFDNLYGYMHISSYNERKINYFVPYCFGFGFSPLPNTF